MVFSSEVFLFGFLPIVLALYFLAPGARLKNVVLVVASLAFYAWGEGRFVALVLLSALVNYGFALALGRANGDGTRSRKLVLAAAIAVDLGILVYFKYTGFLGDNLNFLLGNTIGRQVALLQV